MATGHYKKLCALLLLTLAGACAPEPEVAPLAKNCNNHMPADSTRQEILICEAGSGDTLAQEMLATLYFYGDKYHGIRRDCQKAMWWYTQSAAGGNVSAQVTLGGIYNKKQVRKLPMLAMPNCAERDHLKAYVYLSAASEHLKTDKMPAGQEKNTVPGSPLTQVEDALKSLASQMSPAEITQAKATPVSSILPPIPKD